MVRVLASPSSTTSSIHLFQQRHKHQPRLPHRCIKINSSSRRHRLSVARAMESPAVGVGGSDDAPKNTNPDAIPADQGSAAPSLPLPNIPGWAKLALATILIFAIPVYKKISSVQGAIEKGAGTAANIVEKTAETVQKVAKDVGDKLPPGQLKETFEKIEKIAVNVDKNTEVVEVFIEKVDAFTDKVDEYAQPLIKRGEEFHKTVLIEKKTIPTDK